MVLLLNLRDHQMQFPIAVSVILKSESWFTSLSRSSIRMATTKGRSCHVCHRCPLNGYRLVQKKPRAVLLFLSSPSLPLPPVNTWKRSKTDDDGRRQAGSRPPIRQRKSSWKIPWERSYEATSSCSYGISPVHACSKRGGREREWTLDCHKHQEQKARLWCLTGTHEDGEGRKEKTNYGTLLGLNERSC